MNAAAHDTRDTGDKADFVVVDDVRVETGTHEDAGLDQQRVRGVVLERRAMLRSRSYLIVAACACGGVFLQSIWLVVRETLHQRSVLALAMWIATAALSAWGCIKAMNRARVISAGLRTVEPKIDRVQPDFSALSDGSQRSRNLEDVC